MISISRSAILATILTLVAYSSLIHAQTPTGVQFTVDGTGLKSFSYNGQSYIPQPCLNDNYINMALFQAPDGTQTTYGWTIDVSARGAIKSSSTDGSLNCQSTNPAAVCFQHIYRQGLVHSFTLKVVWSAPDTRTAKADVYIINNDPTDTLTQISLVYLVGTVAMMIPGPVDSESCPGCGWHVGAWGTGDLPAAFIHSSSGSIAIFTDDFTNNSEVKLGTNDPAANPVSLRPYLNNYTTPGGVTGIPGVHGTTVNDPILPGKTYHYPLYIRFGSATETVTSLAPEAFSAFRTALPYLVNWPDRRPIARSITSDRTWSNAHNPRGYFNDPSVDVFPLDAAKQANFSAKVLGLSDAIITRMNAMNPRPQGFLIWELEGQEFYNPYFSYVGNPNKLHDLAPEMDAVADAMFKKYRDAGYRVGMTLRPSNFQTGTVLPATCKSDPVNDDLRDVFIKLDAPYPYRGYSCTSTNTWSQLGAYKPWYQTCTLDDQGIFNNLKGKVEYAKNRWGATFFYVDSTVYCGNGGGNPFSYTVFRQLQKNFPDVIFFPENEDTSWWGASAPYNQVNVGAFDTPQRAKDIYPNSFSALANYDGVNWTDSTIYNRLVQSAKNGTIFMVDGTWDDPTDAKILQVYRDAGYGTTITKPIIESFTSSSPTIAAGQSVTLSWSLSGGTPTGLNIDQDVGSVLGSTSVSVTPLTTTVYTLIASTYAGVTTKSVTVNVTPQGLVAPQNLRVVR